MAIPKFYYFTKPVLVRLRDQQDHSVREIKKDIAREFGYTEQELSERLSSGLQTVFENRTSWATTYLAKAGLIVRPERGMIKITPEGLNVLRENPDVIDIGYLSRFGEFREFFRPGIEAGRSDASADPSENTPDDTFEEAFRSINEKLADELLAEVMKLTPTAFEKMVTDLLQKMGYGAFENSGYTTSATGDAGIDAVILEDKLGFDLIYIQAKQWNPESTVSRPEIQSFVGAISGMGGKGLFVTTAKYSSGAAEYAQKQHIILIDGKKLTKLMIEHDFGVTVKKTFSIKAIDTDIFDEYAD